MDKKQIYTNKELSQVKTEITNTLNNIKTKIISLNNNINNVIEMLPESSETKTDYLKLFGEDSVINNDNNKDINTNLDILSAQYCVIINMTLEALNTNANINESTEIVSLINQYNNAVIQYAGKGKGKGKTRPKRGYFEYVGDYINMFGVCEDGDPNSAIGWAIGAHSYALAHWLLDRF